jgi:hypothetical protein
VFLQDISKVLPYNIPEHVSTVYKGNNNVRACNLHYINITLTVVGTRCADHATPLYPQKSALLRRQRRSLGRYSSLAD